MNSIVRTLHGNPQGGYENFDQAFSALMEDSDIRDNLPFTPENLFGNPDMPQDQRMEEAREAFKLQHDMHQSMRIANEAGIGTGYHRAANAPSSQIDAAAPWAAADATAERRLQGESLQQSLIEEAGRALRGRPSVTSELEEAATQFSAAEEFQERRLQGLIDAPATYREKFGRMLREMPAGAKGIGAAAAGGVALLGAADSPSLPAGGGSEQYDLPQQESSFRIGGGRSTDAPREEEQPNEGSGLSDDAHAHEWSELGSPTPTHKRDAVLTVGLEMSHNNSE